MRSQGSAGIDLSRLFGIIQRKLQLRQNMGQLTLSPTVVPVLDVSALIQDPKSRLLDLDLSGALGGFVTGTGGTVPQNKRWRLILVLHGTAVGVTCVLAAISASRDANNITMQLQGIQAASELTYTVGLVLEAGDAIGGRATGNVADTSIGVRFLYYEEDSSAG